MPRDGNLIQEVVNQGLPRLVLLSVFWWMLTDGEAGSWVVGVATVLVATGISLVLSPHVHWRMRLGGIAHFILFFSWNSLKGGIDVSWRALHPRRPLKPLFYDYKVRLPRGSARIFFVDSISLLPGTLSATLQDEKNCVTVHILTSGPAVIKTMQSLENAVGILFGIDLPPTAVS